MELFIFKNVYKETVTHIVEIIKNELGMQCYVINVILLIVTLALQVLHEVKISQQNLLYVKIVKK